MDVIYIGDDRGTAFVFTADHGMSVKGTHGDGDPHNTQTPIVAWGPGLISPLHHHHQHPASCRFTTNPSSSHPSPCGSPSPPSWHTNHLTRRDMEQADVAALISGISGLGFPVNSVGVVPLEWFEPSAGYEALILWYYFTSITRKWSEIKY